MPTTERRTGKLDSIGADGRDRRCRYCRAAASSEEEGGAANAPRDMLQSRPLVDVLALVCAVLVPAFTAMATAAV